MSDSEKIIELEKKIKYLTEGLELICAVEGMSLSWEEMKDKALSRANAVLRGEPLDDMKSSDDEEY